MSSRYAMLARVAIIGVLLGGCGYGAVAVTAATSAAPVYAANPALPGNALPPSRSAADFARTIAARWSAATAPAPAGNRPVEFAMAGVSVGVYNPGSADGFTAFVATRRTIVVSSDSAARIELSDAGAPRFATPRDQALWRQAGRPPLGQVAAAGTTQAIAPGEFSFLPQGKSLSYRQAAALPATPVRLAAIVMGDLRSGADPRPPASQQLRQLAYLLATAPLTDAVRAAAWRVIAALPGLRLCGSQAGPAGPDTTGLCADSGGTGIAVGVDARHGAIAGIAELLLRPSAMYPHVPAGSAVGASTFLRKGVTS